MNSYNERIKEASEFGKAIAQKVMDLGGGIMDLGGGISDIAKVVANEIPTSVGVPLAGAALGGGGTALYDLVRGNKKNRLIRALAGAGLGGLAGQGINEYADYKAEQAQSRAQYDMLTDMADNIIRRGGSNEDVINHFKTIGVPNWKPEAPLFKRYVNKPWTGTIGTLD